MAASFTFRTAFNGFNREDVVRYIEHLNSQHAATVNQLKSELEYLRAKQPDPPTQSADLGELIEQQAARIRELFDRCRELEQAEADRDAALQKMAQLQTELDAAQNQQNSFQSRMEEELEAYRRAERTERLARQRAEQLYAQANGALGDATAKVDEAASQIGQLSDRVITQLTELQNAVFGSKQALRDAAATMYTIRPTTDSEV